ncbi:hypothetical protein PV10_09164 [Exophiala mesophila]|uniref:Single-strand DNA deaminase toxin A-like C-terminal domain-containing protein n=1 Tax=Exophiala mesophila TaxID=212818 RepID=A0A0D1Z264_EXOME|nr:uncharacterized protein PV10_09164 [Exophiala mesophila]KIV87979.1 hypothetical protein PV10_09164 [Exophiala mesophila]
MDDIVLGLSNLKLDEEAEKYLNAERKTFPVSPQKYLKSVACTSSESPYSRKSCSGWSQRDKWFGYEILCRKEGTLLARQVAGKFGFTFHPDDLDQCGTRDPDYWPGRSQACHAEAQLMAYIYDQMSRTPTTLHQPVAIYTSPRPVCEYCHDFAKHIYVTTGVQFTFYRDGRRELLKCKHCQNIIELGFSCPKITCARLDLEAAFTTCRHALINWAQSLEDFAQYLELAEQALSSAFENSHEMRRLLSSLLALRETTLDLSRVVIESETTMESATHALLSI